MKKIVCNFSAAVLLSSVFGVSVEAMNYGHYWPYFGCPYREGGYSRNSSKEVKRGPIIVGNTSFNGVELVGPGGFISLPDDFMQAVIRGILSLTPGKRFTLFDVFSDCDRERFSGKIGMGDYFACLEGNIKSLEKYLLQIQSNLLFKRVISGKKNVLDGVIWGPYLLPNNSEIRVVGDVIVDEKNQCLYRKGAVIDFSSEQGELLKKVEEGMEMLPLEIKHLSFLLAAVGSKIQIQIQIQKDGKQCCSLDTGLCGKVDKTELQQEYKAQILQRYMGDITVGDVSLKGNLLSIKDGSAIQIINQTEELCIRYLLGSTNCNGMTFNEVHDFLAANRCLVEAPRIKIYSDQLRKYFVENGSSLLLKDVVSPSSGFVVGCIVQEDQEGERPFHDFFLNEVGGYLRKERNTAHISTGVCDLLKKLEGRKNVSVSDVSQDTIKSLSKILKAIGSEMRVIGGPENFSSFYGLFEPYREDDRDRALKIEKIDVPDCRFVGNAMFDGVKLVKPKEPSVKIDEYFQKEVFTCVFSHLENNIVRLDDMFSSDEREHFYGRFGFRDRYLLYLYDSIGSLGESLSRIQSNLLLKRVVDNVVDPLREAGFMWRAYLLPSDGEVLVIGDVILDNKNECLYREGLVVDARIRQRILLEKPEKCKEEEVGHLQLLLKAVGSKIQIQKYGKQCYSLDTGLCGKVDTEKLRNEYRKQILRRYKGDITVLDVSLEGERLAKEGGAAIQITGKQEKLIVRYILSCFNCGINKFKWVSDFLKANSVIVKVSQVKAYCDRIREYLAKIGSSLLLKDVVLPGSESVDGYIVQKKLGEEYEYPDVFLNSESNYLRKGREIVHISSEEAQLLKQFKDGKRVPDASLTTEATINSLRKGLQAVGSVIQIKKVGGQWSFQAPERKISIVPRELGQEHLIPKEISLLSGILGENGNDIRIEAVDGKWSFRATKRETSLAPKSKVVPNEGKKKITIIKRGDKTSSGPNNVRKVNNDKKGDETKGLQHEKAASPSVSLGLFNLYSDNYELFNLIEMSLESGNPATLDDCLSVSAGKGPNDVINAIVEFNQKSLAEFPGKFCGDPIEIKVLLNSRPAGEDQKKLSRLALAVLGYISTPGNVTTYNAISAFLEKLRKADDVLNVIQEFNEKLPSNVIDINFGMSAENRDKLEILFNPSEK